MFAILTGYHSGTYIYIYDRTFWSGGKIFLQFTDSILLDVKTKQVLTESQQLFTAVLTSVSKFLESLPIQGPSCTQSTFEGQFA